MPILNAQVLSGPADGNWLPAGTFNNNGISTAVGKSGANASNGFFRFENINMAASTINTAVARFRASANTSAAISVRIYGVKEANPTDPVSFGDASGRPLTTAFVDWTPGAWLAGTYYDSPDLAAIFQELVDEGYVYSGTQAIMLYVVDNGSAAGVNRGIRTFEHSSTLSIAHIEVDYVSSNDPATIVANTPDAMVFDSLTPTWLFTGSDPEGEDLTYEFEYSDKPDFSGNGSLLGDSYTPGAPVGIVHPNPLFATLTWQGEIQVDDRPGQSFLAMSNGILDRIRVRYGGDILTDGAARVRVYDHQGVYGTSSEPLNPADAADTPTPNWLAESDLLPLAIISDPIQVREFTFTGANRIRLEYNQPYVLIIDWIPNTDDYDNTITVSVDSGLGAAGNAYIDGDSPNNGINLTFDVWFEVYEDVVLVQAASATDPGFANQVTGGDADPFNPDEEIGYTAQSPLEEGVIYYWRARVKDVGSGVWSSYTPVRTFTVTSGGGSGGTSTASRTSLSIGIGI